MEKTEIVNITYITYGDNLPTVAISDELNQKLKKAVKEGACCSVDHYVERTLTESLGK